MIEKVGKLSSNFQPRFINQREAFRQRQIGIAQGVFSEHAKSQSTLSTDGNVRVEEFRVEYGCSGVRVVDGLSQNGWMGNIGPVASLPVDISKAGSIGTSVDRKHHSTAINGAPGDLPTSQE